MKGVERFWQTRPASPSLQIDPVRYTARSYENKSEYGRKKGRSLRLALKRYPRPGAQPLLLIPGIASNDRVWDSRVGKYSFARILHSLGFDVWIGNFRGAGTRGFRSESPGKPDHWTIEDYAVFDLPALVDQVREKTRRHPFLVGHSLAAWVFEGYLAGMHFSPDGEIRTDRNLASFRRLGVRGVVTVAGVYSVWWPKPLESAITDPITSEKDYYRSNYELEALARLPGMRHFVRRVSHLPLGWVRSILGLRLDAVPYVGGALKAVYDSALGRLIDTPILNMFYYHRNISPEVVRLHGLDGLEDFAPRLLEQLGNAILHQQTMSYFHGAEPPEDAYRYSSIRPKFSLPALFVAGTRDRLASAQMIYQDGFLDTASPDKEFISSEAGHLDVISGRNAFLKVMGPVAEWIHARY